MFNLQATDSNLLGLFALIVIITLLTYFIVFTETNTKTTDETLSEKVKIILNLLKETQVTKDNLFTRDDCITFKTINFIFDVNFCMNQLAISKSKNTANLSIYSENLSCKPYFYIYNDFNPMYGQNMILDLTTFEKKEIIKAIEEKFIKKNNEICLEKTKQINEFFESIKNV